MTGVGVLDTTVDHLDLPAVTLSRIWVYWSCASSADFFDEGCVDLDEPPHSPNNRQRFAARLLHNNVLPVAARVEPVCALIAKFVVENSA